ncbi:MAG: hypothetical protein ACTSXX_06425 [Candidatus Baldrarchaeia archaeon]
MKPRKKRKIDPEKTFEDARSMLKIIYRLNYMINSIRRRNPNDAYLNSLLRERTMLLNELKNSVRQLCRSRDKYAIFLLELLLHEINKMGVYNATNT